MGGTSSTEVLNSLYGCRECSKRCENCYARLRIYRFSLSEVHNRDGRYSDLVETYTNPQNLYSKPCIIRPFPQSEFTLVSVESPEPKGASHIACRYRSGDAHGSPCPHGGNRLELRFW